MFSIIHIQRTEDDRFRVWDSHSITDEIKDTPEEAEAFAKDIASGLEARIKWL